MPSSVNFKDINLLTQKSSVAGTERLPVSDTEYITPNQIAALAGGGGGGGDTSSCVHKTGDETVGGDKTFTDNIEVVDASHILYSGGSGGGSQGFTRGYATAVCTDGDFIMFSGISVIPNAYIITLDLSGSSSDVGVIGAIGDSAGNHFVYAASNHQHNYSNADLEPFIESGGLGFLSIGGAPFIAGATYKIVYYTGSGTLTFKTSQVQPGSGATTATFTGTGLTELPAFYAVMLESQVNNESYRRVAYYTNESGGASATPMGVSFYSSQIHNTTSSFSVSYNNGLYINSGGTNAGGYFHNPGTYTLYYLMASDIGGGGGGGGTYTSLADELAAINDAIGDVETLLAAI